MDLVRPKIIQAKIMHMRFKPKPNKFLYSTYYLSLPLDLIESSEISKYITFNKFALNSFYIKDHGNRDCGSLKDWLKNIHLKHNLKPPARACLICMPRFLGYGFNPVSFWLGFDAKDNLTSVVYEVNNTFAESHSYICSNFGRKITSEDVLVANKNLHVSPFFAVEGYYRFKIDLNKGIKINIDYYKNDVLALTTCLNGIAKELGRVELLKASLTRPFNTLKVIFLIHFQALILLFKKAKFHKKPKPPITESSNNFSAKNTSNTN